MPDTSGMQTDTAERISESFAQLSDSQRHFLESLAWFATAPIPVAVWGMDEPARSSARQALTALAESALLRFDETSGDAFVPHVVQVFVRGKMDDASQCRSRATARDLLVAAYPSDACHEGVHELWLRLAPHCRSVLSFIYGTAEETEATTLQSRFATWLYERQEFDEAEVWYKRALVVDEQQLGAEHPYVAMDLGNLALVLLATRRFDESEPLLRRAMAIDEKQLGSDAPEVAMSLSNLGLVLHELGRDAEAEPLYRRALRINELHGAEIEVAANLHNIGLILSAALQFEEAEKQYQRALEIYERLYGPNHLHVVTALNNLGGVLRAANRIGETELIFRRVLGIYENLNGRDHVTVALAANQLSDLLRQTNRNAEAAPLIRRALDIFLKHAFEAGHKHPLLDETLHNYAEVLRATGSSDAAAIQQLAEITAPYGITLGAAFYTSSR